jgi:hypothetical protein
MTFNSGWNEQTGLTGITVGGDFCVVGETVNQFVPSFGFTRGNVGDPIRSWFRYSPIEPTWDEFNPGGAPSNLMIRALVVQTSITTAAPVGGMVMPANTLALVAPWLAVIGLVGCIGTLVVVAKKRRQ